MENNPTNYKAEVWFLYSKRDAEDELEEMLREFMKQNKMYVKGGPVVFWVNYPG